MENKCVICGAVIPEGRLVCPNCEKGTNKGEYVAIIGFCGREIELPLSGGVTEQIINLFYGREDTFYFVATNGEQGAVKSNKIDYVIFKKRAEIEFEIDGAEIAKAVKAQRKTLRV